MEIFSFPKYRYITLFWIFIIEYKPRMYPKGAGPRKRSNEIPHRYNN